MRITWDTVESFFHPKVDMPTLSCAILVSNIATGIFASMVCSLPLGLSLYCFSLTAFMGTALVVPYTWILEDLARNPKYQ